MNLHGNVAVVTGASSGLGEALSMALAKHGCLVVLVARRADRLEALAERIRSAGGTAQVMPADVSVEREAEAMMAQAIALRQRIDILVNNAGRGHFGLVEETTDEVVRSIFGVNVFSLWHCSRPAVVQMKKQGVGRIVTVASLAGKVGYPLNGAYVAAKHAAVGFTHALRQELVNTNIVASVVCPSGIATDFASVTEGGALQSLFSASGPAIKRIAAERGASLPDIEGVMSAEDVAAAIVASLDSTDAEIYTHRGSREFVRLCADDPGRAAQLLLPAAEGELEAYRALTKARPATGLR
jgi:short-subunit dehydrogenase